MSLSQNQRRHGRSGGPGEAKGRESGPDPLAELRQAVVDLDPNGFARCFSAGGWVRIPRPEGDVVLRGSAEIEQIGHELRALLTGLSWTPSQRFVSADQVVEEAVARVRTAPGAADWVPAGELDGQIRVPMRVVAAVDPGGRISSLTVWLDWAALHDPLGVDSARGAASALVAQARARDARGLQVIESEPGAAPLPPVPVPVQRTPGPARPPAAVLWWKQHRATVAGSLMALTAAAVITWVAVGALRPIVNDRAATSAPAASGSVLGADQNADQYADQNANQNTDQNTDQNAGQDAGTTSTAPNDGQPAAKRPVITKQKKKGKPTVQRGKTYTLKADLLFATGSTELTVNARSELRTMAGIIRARKVTGIIQVNGYTDDVGTSADNLQLSKDRALAVAEGLRNELSGVTLELRPQGFGEPADPNITDAGRRQNRKVVIVLPSPKSRRQ
jgi:outer membrane protein OmpA-like peptidoglycan-associated protein